MTGSDDNAPDLRAPSPDAASLLCAVTDIYRNLCTEDGERIDTAISEWQRAALATPSVGIEEPSRQQEAGIDPDGIEKDYIKRLRNLIAALPEWTGHPAASVQRVAVDNAIFEARLAHNDEPTAGDRGEQTRD